MTLAGPVSAELYVTTTGTDTDFVVKLIDVLPAGEPNTDEGFQRLVRAEVMRGKFRDSFENPKPFTSNYVTKVSFQLPDVAHTFKKGHRLMVQVQSSWFPLVDRNPQVFMRIPEAEKADFKNADIRVFHDAEHASQVRVMVVGGQ
jgi:putative CocE/NonD family hydrolase